MESLISWAASCMRFFPFPCKPKIQVTSAETIQVSIGLTNGNRSKNYTKGELALKHAVGLGAQPNVVPEGSPVHNGEPREVEVGWHPVGGLAGKWFADNTGLGKLITDKINKYPDPTQHWAVLVGGFAHQLWMVRLQSQYTNNWKKHTPAYAFLIQDEEFHVIYTNEKVDSQQWKTFKVGQTHFNDDAIRRAGEFLVFHFIIPAWVTLNF